MAQENSTVLDICKLMIVIILLLAGMIFGISRIVHIIRDSPHPSSSTEMSKVMDMQFGDSHFQINTMADNDGVVFSAEKKSSPKKYFAGPWWENMCVYLWALFVWILAVFVRPFIEALSTRIVLNRWLR